MVNVINNRSPLVSEESGEANREVELTRSPQGRREGQSRQQQRKGDLDRKQRNSWCCLVSQTNSRAQNKARSYSVWGLFTWSLLIRFMDVSSFSHAGNVQADPGTPIFPTAFLVAPRKTPLEKPSLFLSMIHILCNNLRATGI